MVSLLTYSTSSKIVFQDNLKVVQLYWEIPLVWSHRGLMKCFSLVWQEFLWLNWLCALLCEGPDPFHALPNPEEQKELCKLWAFRVLHSTDRVAACPVSRSLHTQRWVPSESWVALCVSSSSSIFAITWRQSNSPTQFARSIMHSCHLLSSGTVRYENDI